MNRARRSTRNRSRSLLALVGLAAFALLVGCTNGGGGAGVTTQPAGAPAPAASAPAAQPSAAGGSSY